ncbi:MAG: hypothetical protein AAGF46_07410, partial [Pseudomonadota bacterium]
MFTSSALRWLGPLAIAVLVTACGGDKPLPPVSSDSTRDIVPAGDSGSTAGSEALSSIRSTGLGDDAMGDVDTADALIIYFEYDKSEVSPQYTDLLARHARRLASDPTQRLRLEGHADERGSREYNIG